MIMELKSFRVQNYKNISDTDWIDCEDLTVFVGKNESGKTALFRALSKLKPTDEAKYDPIKEFPHGRYTDEFKKQDWPVASGKFCLTDDEKSELKEICPYLDKLEAVIVTRYYSDETDVEFEPEPQFPTVNSKDWLQFLTKSNKAIEQSVAPNNLGDKWQPIKDQLLQFFNKAVQKAQQQGFTLSTGESNAIRQQISSKMNEEWIKEILGPILEQLDEIDEKLSAENLLEQAEDWVLENIPYFLYFGDYEVLNSAIYLPEFIARLKRGDKVPQTRVQAALFKHVGVDITELARLGQHQRGQANEEPNIRKQIDELHIKADSASQAMTRKFSDWWEQRRHKFRYGFQGDYFRIWVSDDLNQVDVELEERSRGLRYFFSFYLLFLVEAEEEHRECILLLDEPGLHLHGTAQAKLTNFLEKLSEKNQTLYATHSPFMVDGSHLERARAVYETTEGTLVSSDVWPRDRDTLFPLQAALGYSVCQSLFLAKKQVMVEGITDYMLLSILNQQLLPNGKGLNEDIVMIPMGGTTNLAPLASMLVGHDIDIAILLDSDPAGIGSLKKVRNLLTDVDERCVMISQFGGDKNITELEDLIPEDYYLEAFRQAYPNVKLKFNAEENKIGSVIDRINAFFMRKKLGKLEKWRPIQKIIQDINVQNKNVPKELFKTAEEIFSNLNQIFESKKQSS